jgi:hypothetical protein
LSASLPFGLVVTTVGELLAKLGLIGEKLQDKIEAQLSAIKRVPQLIRSFFNAPSVAYITDW